jgi:large subunit ribosomal protein L4
MEVTTYDATGSAGGPATLPADVFDGTVNEAALHQVVTAVLARGRQGTASTKNRAAVRGGARKPWRQKGTGRARQGTIRAAQWRGGGRVFGPSPRSYDVKISKGLKRLAIRSALNARALGGDLALVAPLEMDEPKTRTLAELLGAIVDEDRNVLLLTDGHKPLVYLSARNIPRVLVKAWGEASAYDVLWSDLVLVESTALDEGGAAE